MTYIFLYNAANIIKFFSFLGVWGFFWWTASIYINWLLFFHTISVYFPKVFIQMICNIATEIFMKNS